MLYLGTQGQPVDAHGQLFTPDTFILECVPGPVTSEPYVARFTLPEFTSLCPVTGQPDFAHIIIDYCPDKLLVESKALKLYAGTFRNFGEFHESCTNRIADKIEANASPLWLRICAFWYPRGGIPIDVFIERGTRPRIYIPNPRMDYRGRM